MIKAVIFDIDGVLLPELFRFSERYTKEHNLPSDYLRYFFETEFKECVIGRADLKQVLRNHVQRWGWDRSINELLDYWFESDTVLDQQVLGIIRQLRKGNIKVYVATNQEKYRGKYLTEVLGLGKHVDEVFISAHLGQKKPHPGFYNAIQKQIDLKPEEILFFDDDEENVKGAKGVGWQAYLYKNFKDFEKNINQSFELNLLT